MRPFIAAAALLLSGCASLQAPSPSLTAETLARAEDAARIARQVFRGHNIPVRQTGDRYIADSGYFDATTVWDARELPYRVECALRGTDDLAPARSIMMNILVTTREKQVEEEVTIARQLPNTQTITVLSLRGAGRRNDGARCKLRREYARQLVEEIALQGGRPLRATR